VALSDEQRQEVVGLLAELLLSAARKRAGVSSGGAFASVMDGASGGVTSIGDERAKTQRAA
jgi:hypothetical protein